ncbi:hypothetical protein EVG20_g5145 [Dentipellis fragilis]|uniref:F-box domain-containing protein n=1 Tax=Dentipellis fragilis TaxID=205917 RepID=A0A4Y9YU62_9AGAM|nr:hypothetical protein EVG20_g5145 [Dentipellis fragilis]
MPVVSFPAEILWSISQNVVSPNDLRSLRATNKTLRAIATPSAFRSLSVRDWVKSAKGFIHILEDEALAPYVQEVIFQDASAEYDGFMTDQDDDGEFFSGNDDIEKTIETLQAAFSLLQRLPNLSTLRLVFYPIWIEEHDEDIYDISDELRTELAVLTGVAAASHSLNLHSLTFLNLTSFHNEVFEQPSFHSLFSSLQHLHITNKSVGYAHEGFNSLDPFVEFWERTIPQHFLLPASASAGSALTSLLLHSDEDVGLVPEFSFADLHYPLLTSLSLQRIFFHETTLTEEFILRHKDTLTRLELKECRIAMEEFAETPTEYWSAVYGHLADGLERLTDLAVVERADENGDTATPERPLRYAHLDPGYGFMPAFDVIPGEEGDAVALKEFRAVVAARGAIMGQ